MGFFDNNDRYGYDGSYSSIDESTITMPLYNNRYSSISDMYEVACQLEIDGNDLIHEMDMNILMNEHNYFVEHGRSVQYSDRYGYLTEEGNSVWRFIQKAWETLMKYLDDCVSWVIDKCKEYIIYFKQAWAKWGMKEGLKGLLNKINDNVTTIQTKDDATFKIPIKFDIPGKTIEIALALSEAIGGKGKDVVDQIKKLDDETDVDNGNGGKNKAYYIAKQNLSNYEHTFKIVTNIDSVLADIKKQVMEDGDSIDSIKSNHKDEWEKMGEDTGEIFKIDLDYEFKKNSDKWIDKTDNKTEYDSAYRKLVAISSMGMAAYTILQKDLSDALGKIFEKIRKQKKEVRENRISNREEDGDNEEFKKMKTLIKAYNLLASITMKIFSRGISACSTIVNASTKCLKKVNDSLKSDANKVKSAT